MSLIMGLTGLEQLELFPLELENYTLAYTVINQSAPDLVKIYMTV